MTGAGPKRDGHLPRLAPAHYGGQAVVHWVLSVEGRQTGWLDDAFHSRFRETLLHAQVRYALACAAYCLMPDHAHMIWLGLRHQSDQRLAIRFLEQDVNTYLTPRRLQRQPYDHVLHAAERERGALRSIVYYVFENPVRSGLCETASGYPYSGCMIQGYPRMDIHDRDHWEKFWKIVTPMMEEQSLAQDSVPAP